MRFQQASVFTRALVIIMTLGVLAGCKVTADDIETWKGTVKGPRKICAVLGSDRYPVELRAQAGLALVQMERPIDIQNGEGERTGAEVLRETLQRIDDYEVRKAIVAEMTPGVLAQLADSERPQTEEEDENISGPPPTQVQAKDCAFVIANPNMSQRDTRNQLIDAIVAWYVADFNRRNLAGIFTARQVISSLGSRAASQLVEALNARLPAQTLQQIAQLIQQVGDAETKNTAAERLVAIQREMEGEEFITWIENEMRSRRSADAPERTAEQNRAAAMLNQNNMIGGAIVAMKTLAGAEPIANRMLEIAEDTNASVERRNQALLALDGNAPRSGLQRLLRLATNRQGDPNVRTTALNLISELRDRDALPGLWPLVRLTGSSDMEMRERGQATQSALIIAGSDGVAEVLAQLPTGRDARYRASELEGYALAISQMNPAPTAVMQAQLASGNWWSRVLGLLYLQHAGTEADASRLQGLANDSGATAGPDFGELNTVGKVATHALTQMRERLSSAANTENANGTEAAADAAGGDA